MNRIGHKQWGCKRWGVTLIELLIVMAILVVMAGLGLPSVMRMVDRSRLSSSTRELQAELNRTRIEAMKSGEPLVFHYRPGTGCYEILSKRQYDLRFPKQQPTGMLPDPDSMDGEMMQNAIMPDSSLQLQAVGSTGPTLADYGETSLADSLPASSSLGDYGDGASLADRGPASSFADRMGESDMQMIAAMPVDKFVPVQKELPFDFVFGLQASDSELRESVSPPNPDGWSLEPEAPQWSEPIFFFPNGRTSNANFAVCTPESRRYIDVSVRGLTGTARIGQIEVMP